MAFSSRWKACGIIAAVLLLHVGILAHQAWNDAPTLDESGHLIAGISCWELGRTDLFCVNPPLVRCLAAVPSRFLDLTLDWKDYRDPPMRIEFALGRRLFYHNGMRAMHALRLGRLLCLPLSIVGALGCYFWARDLYGSWAGLSALVMWCACPNILAHAHLITSDLAATSLGLAACYLYWKWLKNSTWELTILTGIALGFAELAKFTLVLLYPVWVILLLVQLIRVSLGMRYAAGKIWRFAIIVILSLIVINGFYGFRGTGKRIRDRQLVAEIIRSNEQDGLFATVDRALLRSYVPIPLPLDYVTGIYVQKNEFQRGRKSFLFGRWLKGDGWWYYYLVCLGLKMPLGILGLIAVSVALGVMRRADVNWFDEFCVLLPAACLLVFVSSQTEVNHHLRYVLPAVPFLYVAASKCVQNQIWRGIRPVVVICLVWSCLSSAWCLPHSLSYFNETVGGPYHGHTVLSHSNTEWGQDLLYLKKWLQRNPTTEPVCLRYTQSCYPSSLGIDVERDDIWPCNRTAPRPGWYALTVNVLQNRANAERLRPYPVIGYAGYSIRIYRVGEQMHDTAQAPVSKPGAGNGTARREAKGRGESE